MGSRGFFENILIIERINMEATCDLSWLFRGDFQRAFNLIDTSPACKSELIKFSNGNVWNCTEKITLSLLRKNEMPIYREIIGKCQADMDISKQLNIAPEDWIQHRIIDYEEHSDFLKYSVCAKVNGKIAGLVTAAPKASYPEKSFERARAREFWKKIDFIHKITSESLPFIFDMSNDNISNKKYVNPKEVLYASNLSILPEFRTARLTIYINAIVSALGYLNDMKFCYACSLDTRFPYWKKFNPWMVKTTYYGDLVVDGKRVFPRPHPNQVHTLLVLPLKSNLINPKL
ncbi:unnamed protein product [Blepharisma stoltei]|uniref:Uncharacterized protein n=1 Tax=Blepharisma stoltei TaxID=1481888 RepID=A0AAU9ITE1_9CILI|nr:unnamed protein product [Blepharisma stoltei]